jgi:hypothetical protein
MILNRKVQSAKNLNAMPYALCPMLYALCSMPYALSPMLYAKVTFQG